MNSISLPSPSPSTTSSVRRRLRDTGFPESFCGNRNTSLPHPDADLSPNACITSDDVPVTKVMHRSRRSFLRKNYKRTISGTLTPEMQQMYVDNSRSSSSSSSSSDSAATDERREKATQDGSGTSSGAGVAVVEEEGECGTTQLSPVESATRHLAVRDEEDSFERMSTTSSVGDDDYYYYRQTHLAPPEIQHRRRSVLKKLRLGK